ncbi:MAG: DUF805 domain-containing protein, partial [Xanthobacteraceae bacterium]
MNFGEAIASGFQNYASFTGRTPRSGYWYWVLFGVLLAIPTNIIDFVIFPTSDYTPVSSLVSLALLLPGLSVSVRRLHDIDRTGWWLLIVLTIIGMFVLLYWCCVKGTDGPNS